MSREEFKLLYEEGLLELLGEEELDEMVHDLKGEEAAEINNGGRDAQIKYLLGNN